MIVGIWVDRGFGALSEERLAVLGATLIIVGIQIFFSSFTCSAPGRAAPAASPLAVRHLRLVPAAAVVVVLVGGGPPGERASGGGPPGGLLVPVGLAAVVVVARSAVVADATAELAPVAVVALALAGLVLGRARLRPLRRIGGRSHARSPSSPSSPRRWC